MQLLNLKCRTEGEKMSEDLRVTKTKQNIQSTFIRLLEDYSFQNITIKQLICECQINRSTIYRNYEDKYDLIYKITGELLAQFQKAINPHFIIIDEKMENYEPYFVPLLNYFEKNRELLILMNKQKLPVNIFNEMFASYSQALFQELTSYYHIHSEKLKMADYYCQIVASNILTAMKWWHLNNPQIDKDALLKMMTLTVTNGIFSSMSAQFR